MKSLIRIIASTACSLMVISSIHSTSFAVKSHLDVATAASVKASKKKSTLPTVGTVKKLVNGDLACYVTLVDDKGKSYNLYGDFRFCGQEKTYLNKKVRLTYKLTNIDSPQCQGRVPCNKKQRVNLVSKMEVIGAKVGTSTTLPKIGTVKRITNGDLLCYVSIVDEKGKQHELGADFGICEQEKAYLNKKVRFTYGLANVNDCQSAEPCGKTRQQQIIEKMELVR
ncbi:hypothetical protein [Calothrix sp. UHCC 0171]|uniref:hypothetical protein n=1 Tax=Calothrix sp. UHCC 0171 TaxID=3110245 RepID=UPI002B1F0145|nr:hypothetical protein [Calothrix sp. UHCC 0171]MEA5573335.1 hypothetical protein [Calothrix sp. UHCC 0171]